VIRKGGRRRRLGEAAGADGAKACGARGPTASRGRPVARPGADGEQIVPPPGDEAAAVRSDTPVWRAVIERGGVQAVHALGAVNPQNGAGCDCS